MYSKELIELYMSKKNYTQQKQVAADMKISKTYLSDIWTEKVQLTDDMGIFIAIECELDPAEVLLKLAAARAKTPQTKNAWAEAVKRYCTGSEAASCAGLGLFAAMAWTHVNFALCGLMLKSRKINNLVIIIPFKGFNHEKAGNVG